MQHVLSVKRCFFQILKFRLFLLRRRRRSNLPKLLNMKLCEFSKPFLDVIFTWGNIWFHSSEVESALFTVTSIAVSDSQV